MRKKILIRSMLPKRTPQIRRRYNNKLKHVSLSSPKIRKKP